MHVASKSADGIVVFGIVVLGYYGIAVMLYWDN